MSETKESPLLSSVPASFSPVRPIKHQKRKKVSSETPRFSSAKPSPLSQPLFELFSGPTEDKFHSVFCFLKTLGNLTRLETIAIFGEHH